MSEKIMCAGAVCLLVVILLAGCPGPNPAVGAWKQSFDGSCAGSNSGVAGMFLYSNGMAEVLTCATQSGTWTLAGNALTVTVSTQGGATTTFQATLSGGTLSNGTFGDIGTGCWTAMKPQF